MVLSHDGCAISQIYLEVILKFSLVIKEKMAASSTVKKNFIKGKRYLKDQWDTLLWILASFGVLYLFEVASNILFNPLVKR